MPPTVTPRAGQQVTGPIYVDPIELLLAATPYPPETDDPNLLIEAANRMAEERAPIIARLSERLGPSDELVARMSAWDRKLADARDALAAARLGLAKARRAYR